MVDNGFTSAVIAVQQFLMFQKRNDRCTFVSEESCSARHPVPRSVGNDVLYGVLAPAVFVIGTRLVAYSIHFFLPSLLDYRRVTERSGRYTQRYRQAPCADGVLRGLAALSSRWIRQNKRKTRAMPPESSLTKNNGKNPVCQRLM